MWLDAMKYFHMAIFACAEDSLGSKNESLC